MSTANVDVAVIGGGLVGLTAALLLADAGCTVVIVDAVTPLPARDEPYDLRTFALTPASRRILAGAGIWPALAAERIAVFNGMEVWDADPRHSLTFAARELAASDELGYIVEQSNLLAACQSVLQRQPAIAGLAGQVTALESTADCCIVQLGDRREVRASAVLACDGAESPVREMLGIQCDDVDYRQQAIVANVTTELPHDRIARQRFLPDGPLAFLPLPHPCMSSIVWTTTPTHAAWARTVGDAEFCAAVTTAFGARLGQVQSTSRRLSFALRRRHARAYSHERVALCGDAAHVIHPLAGQGLNLGLLDVAVLAELFVTGGRRVWAHPQTGLRRYARARRGANLAMLTVCEQLNRLFGLRQPWVRWLRGTGLDAVEHCAPLKRLLAAHAMGERGDLPGLARSAP